LQQFQPLLLSFSGRGELKTLTGSEAAGPAYALRGERLFSGLYMNELLVRLLHRYDAHPALFAGYCDALDGLAGQELTEVLLRRFEMKLLHELGYSFDLQTDGQSGDAVREEGWYHFHGDYGLVERGDGAETGYPAYPGTHLVAIAEGRIEGPAAGTAKRLMRQALAAHLGDTPLKSRDLFRRRARERTGESSP
jgi:DNA repair protein RecO (recombination protein O)